MKRRFLLFTAIIVAVSAVTAISLAQRKPDIADKPITGDFKITIRIFDHADGFGFRRC